VLAGSWAQAAASYGARRHVSIGRIAKINGIGFNMPGKGDSVLETPTPLI